MAAKRIFKICKGCPFDESKGCTSGGDPNSKFLILGESPGKHEVEKGRPFLGCSGKLVQEALLKHDIRLDDCYLVNAMNCKPLRNLDSSKRKKAMKKAAKSCRKRVVKEIFSKERERKVILAFGKYAYYALFGGPENKVPIKITQIKITKKRGEVLCKRKCPVVPTVHPSYVMRGGEQFDDFLEDIKKAVDCFER